MKKIDGLKDVKLGDQPKIESVNNYIVENTKDDGRLYKQILSVYELTYFKKENLKIPESIKIKLNNIIEEELEVMDSLTAVMKIYEKYFTKEEIEVIAKFESSPVGKKLNSLRSTIKQESEVSQEEWMKKQIKKIDRKMLTDPELKSYILGL